MLRRLRRESRLRFIRNARQIKIDVVGYNLVRAAPAIPVERVRDGLRRKIAFKGTRIVVGDDPLDTPDTAVDDQLRRLARFWI